VNFVMERGEELLEFLFFGSFALHFCEWWCGVVNPVIVMEIVDQGVWGWRILEF